MSLEKTKDTIIGYLFLFCLVLFVVIIIHDQFKRAGLEWCFWLIVLILIIGFLSFLLYSKWKYEEYEKNKIQSQNECRRISTRVRNEVWIRDGGKCVRCGSRERLEFDHIVPVSKGGSNTARNIELLCQKCNRSKSAKIE